MADRHPIEQMTAGMDSPFWVRLVDVYDSKWREKIRGVLSCPLEEVAFLRGWVAALEWAIKQPGEIITAMREENAEEEETSGRGP